MSVDFINICHDIFQFINSVGEHIFDYQKYENTNSALYNLCLLRKNMIILLPFAIIHYLIRAYFSIPLAGISSVILSSSILIELLKRLDIKNSFNDFFIFIILFFFTIALAKGIFYLFHGSSSENEKSKSDDETSKVLSTKGVQESTVNQHAAH